MLEYSLQFAFQRPNVNFLVCRTVCIKWYTHMGAVQFTCRTVEVSLHNLPWNILKFCGEMSAVEFRSIQACILCLVFLSALDVQLTKNSLCTKRIYSIVVFISPFCWQKRARERAKKEEKRRRIYWREKQWIDSVTMANVIFFQP